MSDNIVSVSYNLLFPEEIFVDILFRLPIKSLIRFKSVCKKWCNLISNPQFLVKHLLPDRDDRNLMLVKTHLKNNEDYVFSLLSGHNLAHRSQPQPLPELPRIETSDSEYEVFIGILGPCNGLVCLFDTFSIVSRGIILWRLSDGEIRILPPSDVPNPPDVPPQANNSDPKIGFGYDSKSDDYKVLRINLLVYRYGNEYEDEYENEEELCGEKVEIYSFKNDSWKAITDFNVNTFWVGYDRNAICVNGVFLWWEGDENQIMWFQMSDESLGIIMPPAGSEVENMITGYATAAHCRHLFVLNDQNFALVAYNSMRTKEKYFHIWVLLEFGVEESWTKLFTIGPLVRINRPICFWRSDKIVMENNSGEIILYNSFTNETESTNTCEITEYLLIVV